MSWLEETLAEERERKIEKENELNTIKRLYYVHALKIRSSFQLTNLAV